MPKISIIIRTHNESRWLPELLHALTAQDIPTSDYEVIVVDSGSTDGTVSIAERLGCRVLRISQVNFSFGRSLNVGCNAAQGAYLVFISAHCIPIGSAWLRSLTEPLRSGDASYAYGRQQAHELTRFSERQLFLKYYPGESKIPQQGIFCNNANAALPRALWESTRFDEDITGLEDMELAKRLVRQGNKIAYVADASVYHIHQESWSKVRTRYEREGIALKRIMPEIDLHFGDFLRYVISGIFLDCAAAIEKKSFLANAPGIMMFRLMQYWGSYRGNNNHKKISSEMKHEYFFPG